MLHFCIKYSHQVVRKWVILVAMSFISVLLTMTPVRADEIFPTGCVPLVLHEDLVKLKADKPALVMLHNLSSIDLWITHPLTEPSASAGWSSHLQPGHWSALALNDKSFELSCIESRPGHEQQVPCVGLLSICQWPNVETPKNEASGTFWAGEDLSLSALLAHIGSRGFIVPSTAQSVLDSK